MCILCFGNAIKWNGVDEDFWFRVSKSCFCANCSTYAKRETEMQKGSILILNRKFEMEIIEMYRIMKLKLRIYELFAVADVGLIGIEIWLYHKTHAAIADNFHSIRCKMRRLLFFSFIFDVCIILYIRPNPPKNSFPLKLWYFNNTDR